MKFYRGRGMKLDYYRHNHGSTRKASCPNPTQHVKTESGLDTKVKKPLNKKAVIITVSVICAIIIGIVLFSVFTSPKYTHKCVFSTYGTSTSTCQYIGETTYKCIYADDGDVKCKKIKVVKDTAYIPCAYKVKSTVYEKLNQSKYISACTYCHKEKEEIVNRPTTKYKDKIGNWGVIGVSKDDVKKKSATYEFEVLFYTNDNKKINTLTDHYIVLKLYDNKEYLYATYYMQAKILRTGICYHTFIIANYSHRVQYYDHRWELSATIPQNGTNLR